MHAFRTCAGICATVVVVSTTSVLWADSFGTGANHFTIDFVPISGSTNPTSGYGIVTNDYRMGVYEITNDQWSKFKNSLGVPVTGDPATAYNQDPYYTGANVATQNVSWYEAAQFVNWLNTNTGHQAAYKFTGTQGQSNYTFETWSAPEAAGGTNLYRHKDAFYYLPTEDEWVKAGYWNGMSVQTYATKPGDVLHQGNGISGTGWNYYDPEAGYATDPAGPWDVGSGSEELNGTFDMMGNVVEWVESPLSDLGYGIDASRGLRGGGWRSYSTSGLQSSYRAAGGPPYYEYDNSVGFRVAAAVPEPASLALLSVGGLMLVGRWAGNPRRVRR